MDDDWRGAAPQKVVGRPWVRTTGPTKMPRAVTNVENPPPMTLAGDETALFFGDEGRLFGCHHAAATASVACLLVPPFGHEAIRSHRAFRQLAGRLADAGRHVLRFDFTGCGDSFGDADALSLGTWIDDVRAARVEAAARSGADRVVSVGLGLGATLACLAADDEGAIVLWDPVVRGRVWLDGVRTIHEHTLGHFGASNGELLGYPLSSQLTGEIEALDLAAVDVAPARRVLVIDSAREPITDALAVRLRELGATVDVEHRPTPVLLGDDPFKPRVPGAILRTIAAWEGLA